MSALDEHLKKHRRQIIEREEKTFGEMLAAYRAIEIELAASYDELQKQIEAAQAAGEKISPAWFFRENRLKKLLAQVNRQVQIFGGAATDIIEREQEAAINLGIRQAQETFDLEIAQNREGDANLPDARNFAAQLNSRAVETAVGAMGDGSPLAEYFEQQLAPMVAERIKSEVVKAAALGTSFKTIAKRLKETGGITLARALSVARTEVNRVRRETTRQVYEENDDVFSGWEWVASKSSRTCPLCLAMDGRQFPLNEPFPQHPNCRCTLKAAIKGLPAHSRTLGKDWFETQPDEIKLKILGKETFEAYQKHDLTLDDFVAFRNDKRFGKSVTRKPLIKILADRATGSDVAPEVAKSIKFENFDFFKNYLKNNPSRRLKKGETAEKVWIEQTTDILLNNPLARKAFDRIRNNGAKIVFDGSSDSPDYGETRRYKGKVQVTAYLSTTVSPSVTAKTIIHESRHVKRAMMNRPMSTQDEEVMARLLEFVYVFERRPTTAERAIIRREVEKLYPDLPKTHL